MFNIFRPRSKESQQESKSGGVIADNSVLLENRLIDSIVKVLKPIRLKRKEVKLITLYVNNSDNDLAVTTMANTPEFEEKLFTALENAGINEALNSQWYCKRESAPSNAIQIDNGLFIIHSFVSNLPQTKAKISVLQGVLKLNLYELEFEPLKRYNIGRGERPRLDNGMIHQNQIVILEENEFPDNNHEEYEEFNRYVSRKHAYILADGKGFALKVYPGGCHLDNNRTRILRENTLPVDIQNPEIAYPLQHEDQIELGKKVILLFEIV